MLRLKQFFIILSIFNFQKMMAEELPDWTWSYKKKIHENELKQLSEKKTIIFSKINTPHFTQLVFSWNAFRPTHGHFSFYVQPRDAHTKKWGKWYKMVDWGNGVQRSHTNCLIPKNESCYVYVRLENPHTKLADGFNLKIVTNGNANLSCLRFFNICISDFTKFRIEKIDKNILELPSVEIKGVPEKSQMEVNHEDNKKICSPTSTSMLVSFLSQKKFDPLEFALKSYDNGLAVYGSWPFNTSHAFECFANYYFFVTRLKSFKELHSYLMKNIPVVISVRGKIIGAPLEYNKGHLILIIGWDKEKQEVICHDPAFDSADKVYHRYNLSTLLRAWELSNRLAYCSIKRDSFF